MTARAETTPPRPRRIALGGDSGAALPLTVGVLAGAVTLAVALLPPLRFAYHEPQLHVAIETAATVIAWTAAGLALGRFHRGYALSELLLFAALACVAAATTVFAVVPAAFVLVQPGFAWGSAVAGTLGAAVLALAAFAPARRLSEPLRARRIALESVGVAIAGVGLVVVLLRNRLPEDLVSTVGDASRPDLDGNPALLALQLLGMALFGIAAAGFARKAALTHDDFLRWLGVGAVLSAASRLNYFLYPSRFSEWVYTGDAFRLLAWTVIAVAAAREIRTYWQRAAEAAVLEERRRLARELHDGLAQELRYVERHARRLDGDLGTRVRVERGIERAILESRRAIAALSGPIDEPLDTALVRAAQEAGRRVGTAVVVDADPHVQVTRDQREALLRIAAEAVANAGRHGGAPVVAVRLTNGDGIRLSVVDRGRGFDPQVEVEGSRTGFGLVSMRERAAVIGASLSIESAPGGGTRVEVTL